MPVTLHHANLSTGYSGPLMFYPPGKTGKLIPFYGDRQTRDALIGSRTEGALRDLIKSVTPGNGSNKLYLPGSDGKLHHVELYSDASGRTCINTFNQPELPCFVGPNQDYSPDVIGISLYLKNLPQTTDTVLAEAGYPTGVRWFEGKFQHPVYGAENQAKALINGGRTINSRTEIPKEKQSLTPEAVEAGKTIAMDLNRELIKKSIRQGVIQTPFEKNGMIYVPNAVIDCLKIRGIDSRNLSMNALRNIGFCTGMKPYSNEGKPFRSSLKGFMIRLGNADGSSWQMRICDINESGNIVFRQKQDGMRFVTLGPAYPFLLEEAIRDSAATGRPIFLSEGMFDTLSMDVASEGRLSVASIQGCQNQYYLQQASERIAEKGIPVIVAFDPDLSGQTNSAELIERLRITGVHVYGWPGALVKDGDMNDLLKESPESASALAGFMADMVFLSEKGLLTPDLTNRIMGSKSAHPGMDPADCVNAAFETVRHTCGTAEIIALSQRSSAVREGMNQSQGTTPVRNAEKALVGPTRI